MADDAPTAPSLVRQWRERVASRRMMLLAAGVVLVGLLAFGQLSLLAAVVGFLGVASGAALLPTVSDFGSRSGSIGAGEGPDVDALRLFADALPDPCLILDRRGRVLHRNEPASRHFPDVVPGGHLSMSLRAPAVPRALEAVREDGKPRTVELHLTVPTETWHRVTVAPLAAEHGNGILVVTLQSLTAERRIETLRTDFIANASHELRTPLTSLLGFIDTLSGPAAGDPAAQEKFLGIMRGQAMRMSKLIDDLLSLSRIEMRQHVRPTGSVDLALALREVRDGLQTQAAEAGVAINLDLPDSPVSVTGDRDELYEVFENLIDNAIKYGADGKKVDVALALVADRPGYDIAVTVTDHGSGIEAEHVPRLTERFYRVDAESSRRKKGTGLGLAIVKHIVNRHRGAMSIRSRPGEGTRVEVLLPR